MAALLRRPGRPAFRRRWFAALFRVTVYAAVGFAAVKAPEAPDEAYGEKITATANRAVAEKPVGEAVGGSQVAGAAAPFMPQAVGGDAWTAYATWRCSRASSGPASG